MLILSQAFLFGKVADNATKAPCIPCEELAYLVLPDIIISHASNEKEPVAHCKVIGRIGNEINFELLLPQKWNTRFAMGGGGGFVGSIQNMAKGTIKKGFATAGTDTGHQGNGIKADWALNNMERQVNFGHLAIHRTAVVSKVIISQFYCSKPEYSYFLGCSRGGGQAMMEAQRYPDDFDGIVTGAPAFNWSALGAEFIQNSQAIYPNPNRLDEPVITQANLKLLQSMILDQCDGLDGIEDQILNDPMECDFNFDLLQTCEGDTEGDDCFTLAQIEAIKTVYAGVTIGNKEIYPGFPPGGENEQGGWNPWIVGPKERAEGMDFPSLQFGFGTEMFKYLIFQNPDWDYSSYDYHDFEKQTEYASAYLDATSIDYSAFKAHGGKMILYHGWNDPALSALATIEHYEAAKKEDSELGNYIRLFLLPGVLHCGGGPGPSQADWLELAVNWVEHGEAPERVIVSKSGGKGGSISRPVFPYPKKAIYKGKGNPNKETSFN